MWRQRCPVCAERVRREAKICRFCQHEFAPLDEAGIKASRSPLILGFVLLAVAAVSAGYSAMVTRDLAARGTEGAPDLSYDERLASPDETTEPLHELLPVGAKLDWIADQVEDGLIRGAGPYVITVRKKLDGDLVAPVIELRFRDEIITMTGNLASPSFPHQIGSRILFAPEIGVGAQLTDRVSVEASWVHLSHAQLFSRHNPGMDTIGLRLNYRFR